MGTLRHVVCIAGTSEPSEASEIGKRSKTSDPCVTSEPRDCGSNSDSWGR